MFGCAVSRLRLGGGIRLPSGLVLRVLPAGWGSWLATLVEAAGGRPSWAAPAGPSIAVDIRRLTSPMAWSGCCAALARVGVPFFDEGAQAVANLRCRYTES